MQDARFDHHEQAEVAPENSDSEESDDEDDNINIDIDQNETARAIARIPEEERSSHFIAIRITNPEIVAKAKEIQTDAVNQEEALGDCCMGTGLFHVTLSMLRLEGPEGAAEAVQALEAIKPELQRLSDGLNLKVAGLDTFGQRVLYAQVKPEPEAAFWELAR